MEASAGRRVQFTAAARSPESSATTSTSQWRATRPWRASSRPTRSCTLSRRLTVRGLASPSESAPRAFSKRFEKRSRMAFSLLRPLRRVAVQAHLAVGAHRGSLQVHGASAAGDARRRRRGVERAPALAAHRQAAVAGLAQPRHPALGGDAAVHRRQRPGRRAERGQHGLERVLLADAAGEHLRAAREAAAVERQPEGEQRAVAALLLGVAARRLRELRRGALEAGVGEGRAGSPSAGSRTAPPRRRTGAPRSPRGAP